MNDAKKKAVSSAMVENMSVLCLFQRKKAATFKDVRTAVTIVTYVISIKCIYNYSPSFLLSEMVTTAPSRTRSLRGTRSGLRRPGPGVWPGSSQHVSALKKLEF